MKSITIDELEKMNPKTITVIDIRKEEDIVKNPYPHAIPISPKQLEEKIPALDRAKPVCVLCYTGKNSEDIAEKLEEAGYEAFNIFGGYRSYLRKQLSLLVQEEEAIKERTKEIERSIIKKFRKPIWRKFTKGIQDYQLIQEGDKIAVCISGGKDSMLMAKLLQELQRHGQISFELVFLVMNPGYNQDNWNIIQNNAKLHSTNFEGMELIRPMYLVKEADIKAWRDYNKLHFIQCACRFTENCATCGGGRGSKRDEMKELIAKFRETSDVIESNIFRSIHNINLRTVIGYHKDDMEYNFLDDYS